MAALAKVEHGSSYSVSLHVSQCSHGHRGEKNSPRLSVFRVTNIGESIFQPHVVPGEPQCLAKSHPRVTERDEERGELRADFLGFGEDRFGLLGPEPCSCFI